MTLKDKKNKREYNNKLKAQGGVKESERNKDSKGKSKKNENQISQPNPSTSSQPNNFEGVAEDATKLISEANERYLAAEAKVEDIDTKYAKRNITSNWTKYELPSSDEEDEIDQEMTGADFQYVLSSAQGAESHFRLKSEKEWEEHTDAPSEFSEEFFSLDLTHLENTLKSIPFHKQICLDEKELDIETLEMFVKKAESNSSGSLHKAVENEEMINKKMMEILSLGKIEKSKDTKDKEKLDIIKDSEQKQFPFATNIEPSQSPIEKPLGQRTNRRQRCSKLDTTNGEIQIAAKKNEVEDLEFLDSLEKEREEKDFIASSSSVVPVKIVPEETKNLEDWLDDFLDE